MKLAKLVVNGANPISDEDEARIRKVLQRGNPPKGDIWSYERGLAGTVPNCLPNCLPI